MGAPIRTENTSVERLLLYGVWGLPVYGVLLALSTITHQPDYTIDFPEYASYVTTDTFLASHLVASIGGAAVGVIGIVCVAVLLVAYGTRPGRTMLGGALSVAGNVVSTSIFGVATFAQPAIGRAYQAGTTQAVEDLNADVYGTELAITAVVGLLLFIAGAIMLGLAMVRADRRLRWPGIVYAVSLPVFVVAGFTVVVLQPLAAVALTVATVFLAARMSRMVRPATDVVPA